MFVPSDYLPPVDSLEVGAQDSTILLSWAAPHSLSTLTYCISVTNSTAQRVVDSECGITQMQFTYPMPQRTFCDVYLFSVSPVNENGKGAEITTSFYGTQESMPAILSAPLANNDTFSCPLYRGCPCFGGSLSEIPLYNGKKCYRVSLESSMTFLALQVRH